jgi:hypothetical protein
MQTRGVSTVAAPLHRLRAPVARFRALPVAVQVALGVAFIAGFSLALRTQAIHARYWIDEGLSIGIAQHPLLDIPGVMRQDGSPPLYYMLLSVWIGLFGIGEADTHVLSLAFAIALVPTVFLAARALFGRRAAWFGAVLAAMNPFITYYAQETRMYTLVALLSVVVTGTFVLGFVQRRRAWLAGFAPGLAILVYAPNWGLFLGVATVAALAALLATAPARERVGLLRDAGLAYGAVGLVYLPWVPTLLFQARHTGAPWATRPDPQRAVTALTSLLGGPAPAVAFALVAGSGIAVMLRSRRLHNVEARTALAVVIIGAVALLVAWTTSQVSPAWATRYLAILIGPLLLLGAGGLARAGALGAVALAALAIFWAGPRVGALESKSNAHTAAVLVRDRLEPGDLVVAIHPEQGPVMRLYLPPGLRWANAMGFVRDPRILDWRDVTDRLKAAKPAATSDMMVRALRPGQRLVLVQPIVRSGSWRAPWTSLVRRRAAQWERRLDEDPRVSRVLAVPRLRGRPLPRGVRIVLYERR